MAQPRSHHRSYALARGGVAFIWLYHGLVPKLLFRDATELALIEQGPIFHSALTTLYLAGIAECALAAAVLLFWHQRWPLFVSLLAFVCLLGGALVLDPQLATRAFNPVTLSISGGLFCLISLSARAPAADPDSATR